MLRLGFSSCFLWLTATYGQTWPELLLRLNQPNVLPNSVFTDDLNTDLSARDAADRRAIKPICTSADRGKTNRCFQSEIAKRNTGTLDRIAELKKTSSDTEYAMLAAQVRKDVTAHPVAGIAATHGLPNSGEIGYCFGRALLAHRELLRHGVPQSELVKVFALGELMMEGQFWNFHVAIGVRDRQHGLLIVDALQERVLPVSQWMERVQGYDIKKPFSRVRFYLTDPRKFLPASGRYDQKELNDPHLRAYFSRLAKSLN